jgi:hypothetical protein
MLPFLQTWLLALAWLHLAVGIALPFVAYSGAFGYYSGLLQQIFWPSAAVPAETVEFQRWIVALFGPTLASVGVVMVYLVRAGIRTGETWPWTAILLALAVWAPGDIGISMMRNFRLHLWVDIAALLAMVPPAVVLRTRAAGAQA